MSFSAESSAVRPWPLVLVLDERIGDNALIDAAQRAQSACAEERTDRRSRVATLHVISITAESDAGSPC